ncbi:MAG TPA: hypothetical protein VIH18_28145 [Candidatus Binatia bacterium]
MGRTAPAKLPRCSHALDDLLSGAEASLWAAILEPGRNDLDAYFTERRCPGSRPSHLQDRGSTSAAAPR